ncbi:MAG TPA: hypothetical protein VMW56_22815 [Candidatus Margulisiibacteriota bacterium]|nr:hypothetical protein [Candidatus Margulisiibacteriota bacterium]
MNHVNALQNWLLAASNIGGLPHYAVLLVVVVYIGDKVLPNVDAIKANNTWHAIWNPINAILLRLLGQFPYLGAFLAWLDSPDANLSCTPKKKEAPPAAADQAVQK